MDAADPRRQWVWRTRLQGKRHAGDARSSVPRHLGNVEEGGALQTKALWPGWSVPAAMAYAWPERGGAGAQEAAELNTLSLGA